jgi:hypothetical protein
MEDLLVGSEKSKGLFIAGLLFLVAAAIDAVVAVLHHDRLLGVAGVFGLVAGILLLRSSRQK